MVGTAPLFAARQGSGKSFEQVDDEAERPDEEGRDGRLGLESVWIVRLAETAFWVLLWVEGLVRAQEVMRNEWYSCRNPFRPEGLCKRTTGIEHTS